MEKAHRMGMQDAGLGIGRFHGVSQGNVAQHYRLYLA